MNTGHHRGSYLRRAAIGVVTALAGLSFAISPAAAASGNDGTSNTIQFSLSSATIDQAHHRVLLTAPAGSDLAPGRHIATVEVMTPRLTIILENVLVSSLMETPSSLALNYTAINVSAP